MKFDVYAAVSTLRQNFPVLNDLDRAVRIAEILQHKMSGRTLAKALGCSEKTVRNLSSLADAPKQVQLKLKDGSISTREALRLIKAESVLRQQNEIKKKIELTNLTVKQVAEKVTSWLQQLGKGAAEQTALEAKWMLINAANSDSLPKERAPQGWTVDTIIAKFKPRELDKEVTSYLHRYATWLARWVFFVAPDPDIHVAALELAWERTIARPA